MKDPVCKIFKHPLSIHPHTPVLLLFHKANGVVSHLSTDDHPFLQLEDGMLLIDGGVSVVHVLQTFTRRDADGAGVPFCEHFLLSREDTVHAGGDGVVEVAFEEYLEVVEVKLVVFDLPNAKIAAVAGSRFGGQLDIVRFEVGVEGLGSHPRWLAVVNEFFGQLCSHGVIFWLWFAPCEQGKNKHEFPRLPELAHIEINKV